MALEKIGIMGSLILLFLGSAIFIPLIQGGFSSVDTTVSTDKYGDDIIQEGADLSLNPLSFAGVFINVFKLAWVGVAGLPFWLDLMYTFASVMLILVLATYIPTID